VIFQPRVALSPRVRRNLAAYLFIGPALFLLVLFNIWPALYTAWLSLQDYGILGSNGFVGLRNYVHVIGDGLFWHSLVVTSVYAAGSAVFGLAGALGLAVLVTRRLPFMGWFRVLYFVPSVTSLFVNATIFSWLMDYNLGLFNYWLISLHWQRVPWLQQASWALFSIILVGAWGGVSYNLPIYAAALGSVNRELYEAAALDGANGWQRFWSITLPSIAPITRYTVILAIIGSFQLIASIDALTGGGPENATLVTIKYIQTQGWEFLHFGYASAITLFLLVFLLVVTWLQLRSGRE
jgi:ABC-type sugar transport system permease subunit